MSTTFPAELDAILERMERINPVSYGRTRNYVDGNVSYLSPYLSRGVISTSQVLLHCKSRDFAFETIEKFIQELAWRDYWQRVWQQKDVNHSVKNEQENVLHREIPTSIVEGKTGIEAIDKAILHFYESGYIHNHVRMYIASIASNIGRAHWHMPAQWMYYHLLDGDWASNALSWQWVCGANSNKKYYANQENINRYCHSKQVQTFLDQAYEDLVHMPIPTCLEKHRSYKFETKFPSFEPFALEKKSTALYTWYNMDPFWRKEEDLNRVLLIEPSHFAQLPISNKSMQFLLDLRKNIPDVHVYVGEFSALQKNYPEMQFIYKEHPTNRHFIGQEDPRDWMSAVSGYFPSFFAYWKKVRKDIAW